LTLHVNSMIWLARKISLSIYTTIMGTGRLFEFNPNPFPRSKNSISDVSHDAFSFTQHNHSVTDADLL